MGMRASSNRAGPSLGTPGHSNPGLSWAACELDPDTAARTTMYTSCQPCGMCSGAIARSGLGRVVYALSTEQWAQLNPGFERPGVPSDGPALFDEARIPIDRYHQP